MVLKRRAFIIQTQNHHAAGLLLKDSPQDSFETKKYLNLPDLQFYNWCNRQYGVNRGVYNTIDQWFYEYGIINIYHRRSFLLAFLEFVKDEGIEQNQHQCIRFGHGGLTKSLNDFLNESEQISEVITQKK